MKRVRLSLYGSALAVCLFAGVAQAGTVPPDVQFTFQWSVSSPTNSKIAPQVGSSADFIQLTPDLPHLITLSPTGNTTPANIGAVYLQGFSTATGSNPDQFKSAPFTLSLTLTDLTGGKNVNSTPLLFHGTVSGDLSKDWSSLVSTLNASDVSQKVTVNGHTYNVTVPLPSTLISVPGSLVPGSFLGQVQVSVSNSSSPEPSALVLSGLGVVGLGVGCWLKRRRSGLFAGAAA
jgi:hypothetical protein